MGWVGLAKTNRPMFNCGLVARISVSITKSTTRWQNCPHRCPRSETSPRRQSTSAGTPFISTTLQSSAQRYNTTNWQHSSSAYVTLRSCSAASRDRMTRTIAMMSWHLPPQPGLCGWQITGYSCLTWRWRAPPQNRVSLYV